MNSLTPHNLQLVALQYELALVVGQDLRVQPMLRKFFTPAMKLLGCHSAHVWLIDDGSGRFEHRFSYPARSAARWMDQPGIVEALTVYRERAEQPEAVTLENGQFLQFMPLANTGFCLMLRQGPPLANELITALGPIFDRLATACRASLEYEKTEQLRELASTNEQRLSTVVETVSEVIFQASASGEVEFINSAWARITGFGAEDVVGHSIGDFFCSLDGDAAHQALRQMLADEDRSTLRLETRLRAADGSRPWVTVQIHRLYHDNPEHTGFIGTIVDITEQRRIIDELVSARARAEEASEAKSAFLANMSHEIRTPMNAIIGLTQLVLDEALESEVRRNLEMVRGSAEHLLTIINDILDFSKIEAGHLDFVSERFDLRELIRSALDSVKVLAENKKLALRCDIEPLVPRLVMGDAARLKQVLLNLMGNAIKFTERGSVRLAVAPDPNDDYGHTLRFDIIDTGIGIAPDKHERIFEAFSQADESINRAFGGTGLGLTISKKLVDMMQGELSLHSDVGKGSTFSFTARLERITEDEASARLSPPAAATPAETHRSLTILVAEDNAINQRLMKNLLEKLGHQIEFADNGLIATQACERTTFDLVLMDMQMPVMDGLTATRNIRERETLHGSAPVAIVALTANAMQGDRERCMDAGMDGYLSKPLRRAELEQVLAEIQRLKAT